MRYFYDFEFFERGGMGIEPISVGFVAEDGRELYLENAYFDWSVVPQDHFLIDNVLPYLEGADSVYAVSKFEMGETIKEFVTQTENNQLWGYYADYDHVTLAQLYGRMVNMPDGLPWVTLDIKQEAIRLGSPDLPLQYEVEHHALADARWNKQAWDYLNVFDHGWGVTGP